MSTKETGLRLTPRPSDAKQINEIIEASVFYAEYNSVYGFYFFEEEEENYDSLEAELHKLFEGTNLNYRIEGVF